jgi:threonine/homoserine efflux transporter RhtA
MALVVAVMAFDAAVDGLLVEVDVVVEVVPAGVSVVVVFFSQATSNVAAARTERTAAWVLLAFMGVS